MRVRETAGGVLVVPPPHIRGAVCHRYMSPTIVTATEESKCMQDEIFGPILPVLTVPDLKAAIRFVRRRPKPLSLYVESQRGAIRSTPHSTELTRFVLALAAGMSSPRQRQSPKTCCFTHPPALRV